MARREDEIDFPVSAAYANYYREQGYYVPPRLVRLDTRPIPRQEVVDERKVTLLQSKVDELLALVDAMDKEHTAEITKIKGYLNEQHKKAQEQSGPFQFNNRREQSRQPRPQEDISDGLDI